MKMHRKNQNTARLPTRENTKRSSMLRYSKGMGLLDTMIALSVVVIGIMAAISLFNKSTASSSLAANQLNASRTANMLIEQMRSNSPAAAANGAYNFNTQSAPPNCNTSIPTCINNSISNACTPEQIAAASYKSMVCDSNGLFNSLPQARLVSSCAGQANSDRVICEVTVSWQSFKDSSPKSVEFKDIVL